ncbi:MAG: alpha/beta fold hydrolase [Alphaproteobacteria bacterium]|nr:alpha/beta fold hydrolase [Alphaproteobacteria bacterium]
MVAIRRGFIRIAEGQVHYRAAAGDRSRLPLVLIHMSPVASGSLVPLIQGLGGARPVWAPDTLGNGDSCPPAVAQPEIGYYADAVARSLDALGIERFDLYGVRTGASIATELAITRPGRVRRLVLDDVRIHSIATMTAATEMPCPPPDQIGSQLGWAWHVMRDHAVFFPWFQPDAAHRIQMDLYDADYLHELVVEVLKAVRTFSISYGASFRYKRGERVPLLRLPTMVIDEPGHTVFPDTSGTAALIPGGVVGELPPGDKSPHATAEVINRFLDG